VGACEAFARRLEQYRSAGGGIPIAPKKKGAPLKPLTIAGRAFRKALERQIAAVEADIENTRPFSEETAVDIDVRLLTPLRDLRETMERTRLVWDPSIPKHEHWHVWANFIAQNAIVLWGVSGRTTFRRDPSSPLVKFVGKALFRTTGRHYEEAAIAKALQRLPAMNWVLDEQGERRRLMGKDKEGKSTIKNTDITLV
jgi:hypothetical protein